MTDSDPSRESGSRTPAGRDRAAWWGGMLVSVLIHGLAFLLWPGATILLESVGGSDADRVLDRSDPVRLVRLAAPDRRSASEASSPLLVRRGPEIAVRRLEASRPALDLNRADPLPSRPRAAPPTRRGDSGLLVAGEERYAQPIARAILPDWRPPRSLHGLAVTARVYVDAAGDPTGLVELVPPTRNRQVNREIVYRVRRLEYRPARRNGEPIAAWAEITFVFCRTGVTATSPAPPRLLQAPCAHES